MRIAVYPGTFDPITLGHRDLVVRATGLFDRVVIGVATSARKAPLLTLSDRVTLVKEALHDLPQVVVEPLEQLLVDFAVMHHAQFLLRGLRNSVDFSYEADMAQLNRTLCPELETVFLPARPEIAAISSTMVREIYQLGGNLAALVPANVYRFLQSKRKHGA